MRNLEEWADDHGYARIHCKKHGNSWSDGGICEACYDDRNMCDGCGDIQVKESGDFCEECKTEMRENSLHEDPAKSHGRGGM